MCRGRLEHVSFPLYLVSCRTYNGKAFHIRGPAAEKLLSPKLLCVRGTMHILSGTEAESGQCPQAE